MSANFDVYRAELWAAEIAALMTDMVRVKPSGRPLVDVHVEWHEPDSSRLDSRSTDYVMQYRRDDLPTLVEGDHVTRLDSDGNVIAKGKFKVREPTYVSNNPGDDQSGYFRFATLTQL